MKGRLLLISFCAVTLVTVIIITLSGLINQKQQYTPRTLKETSKTYGIKGAVEYLNTIRNNQVTGTLDIKDVIQSRIENEVAGNVKSALNLNWKELGPDNIGGRTRAILIDKDNPTIIYAGGVSGGLWKSTTGGSSWNKINDMAENLAISCIAQNPVNGDIYVGTGESFASYGGAANGNSGFVGSGIYYSNDGDSFTLIPTTEPSATNNPQIEWAFINKLAVGQNGRIYAATNMGLRASDDNGANWYNPVKKTNGTDYDANTTDVKIASDGTVITSVYNLCYISPTGDNNTFVLQSSNNGTDLPVGNVGRIEFAFAPSNPAIVYASMANPSQQLRGIYRSTDKGDTWTLIGPPGSTSFQPFGTQGGYNNVIVVDPSNPDRILLGGIDMWEWKLGGTWEQKTLWFLDPTDQYYVHADQHVYVFHPSNPKVLYVGSDGGISVSTDGANTFHTLNRSYNTVQFYTVGVHPYGYVAGGTQDNGTIIIDFKGNQIMNGRKIMGGDGGYVGFSYINPDVMFSTVYYGDIARSADIGYTFSKQSNTETGDKNEFFNARINSLSGIGENSGFASFVTPYVHWESFNNYASVDSVSFIADSNYSAGDVVTVNSKTDKYPFDFLLPYSINTGDSIKVQDIISSRFYFGASGSVWMTKDALNFAKTPAWIKLSNISGVTQSMAVSTDGNYLWVGTANGNLYRVSNLLSVRDSANDDITSPYSIVETRLINTINSGSRAITSIAIDPRNPEHVIVTLGNYKNTVYVYRTTNALDSMPSWVSKQGNLPKMPVYSAIVEMNHSNTVIVATEYGIYATDNIAASNVQWTKENSGLANVPVHMLQQQVYNYPGVKNLGVIYAGTHGRGIFSTDKYVGVNENAPQTAVVKNSLRIFPNPANEKTNIFYTLSEPSNVTMNIYDLSGRIVKKQELGNISKGAHQLTVFCNDLQSGSYIVQIVSGKENITGKLNVSM